MIEITIKVGGQDEDELDNAIDIYDDLRAQNVDFTRLYLSFGNNLVMAPLVARLLHSDFTPCQTTNDELTFYKEKR